MKRNIYKSTLFLLGAAIISCLMVPKTWGALNLTPIEPSSKVVNGHRVDNLYKKFLSIGKSTSESTAPEPTTFALIGGSILGMIVNFIRRTYSVGKRIFDVFTSVLAILILAPLFLMVALVIKLTSRGPAIYTQDRVGKDGKIFKIYKFRTMHVDAEKVSGPVWAAVNDHRLIPCGRFIRKAHIDEIPQFINVLKGEMSVVGPRPERPVFVEKFKVTIPDYEKRLAVKPGITGMAQVWHKYDETIHDVRKKIKYDLLYIKKICLWTDLRIFFRTFRVVLTGQGAH